MVFLKQALAAATCITSAVAVDVLVQSSGGNVTGKFGHPYGYGFLHEVSPSSVQPTAGFCLTLTLTQGY
jgi:hypothetical protein